MSRASFRGPEQSERAGRELSSAEISSSLNALPHLFFIEQVMAIPTAVPAHTAETVNELPENAFVLKRTNQLAGLLTIIRDKNTSR